jgi:hypothetical protein
MNINTANAEKLFAVDGPAQEAPPEVKDPIEELNPIQLLKKPGSSRSMQTSSKRPFFPWCASQKRPSRPRTTNELLWPSPNARICWMYLQVDSVGEEHPEGNQSALETGGVLQPGLLLSLYS